MLSKFTRRTDRAPIVRGYRRLQIAGVLIVCVALGLTGCASNSSGSGSGSGGGGGANSAKTLKIGFVTTLSNNSFSAVGEQSKAAFDAALAHVKAENNGLDVQSVSGDDGGDPRQATETCKRLIQQDNVQIIVAVMLTPDKNACTLIAQQAGVPFIAGQQSAANCGPDYYQTGWVPNQTIVPLVNYLVQTNRKTIYFVGNDYAFDKDILTQLTTYAQSKGIQVIGNSLAPLGTTNWSPILGRVASANADVVVDAMVDEVAYAKQAGLDPQTASKERISLVADESQLHAVGAAAANGLKYVSQYSSTASNPANVAFKKELNAASGGSVQPSLTSVNLYNATLVAAAAAAKGTDKKSLNAAIPNVTIEGPGGQLAFNGAHNPSMTAVVAQVDANLQPSVLYTDKPLAADTGCK